MNFAPLELAEVLKNSNLDKGLLAIAGKIQNNERISDGEGLLLFEKGELGFVGALANYIPAVYTITRFTSTVIFISSQRTSACSPAISAPIHACISIAMTDGS